MGYSNTWTCHVCGEERPDALIGVAKHDISKEHNLPPGTMTTNTRYCLDKPDCALAAEQYNLMQIQRGEHKQ